MCTRWRKTIIMNMNTHSLTHSPNSPTHTHDTVVENGRKPEVEEKWRCNTYNTLQTTRVNQEIYRLIAFRISSNSSIQYRLQRAQHAAIELELRWHGTTIRFLCSSPTNLPPFPVFSRKFVRLVLRHMLPNFMQAPTYKSGTRFTKLLQCKYVQCAFNLYFVYIITH